MNINFVGVLEFTHISEAFNTQTLTEASQRHRRLPI